MLTKYIVIARSDLIHNRNKEAPIKCKQLYTEILILVLEYDTGKDNRVTMVEECKSPSSGGFLANVAERVIDPLAETDPGSLQVSS